MSDPLLKSPLLYAIIYARRGWRVLPLYGVVDGVCECGFSKPDCVESDPSKWGKHPRTMHGVLDATSDEDQVRAWFKMWPHSNVGIRMGSGLIGYDIDPSHGGQQTYADLIAGHDDPVCPTVLTGSGGMHLYFAGEFPKPGNGAGGTGIDIKCEGGYLVAPPSLHGVGERYEWLSFAVEPVPMPEWLRPAPKPTGGTVSLLEPRPRLRDRCLRNECREASNRRDGQGRRDELYKAGLKLSRFVLSGDLRPDDIEHALTLAGLDSGLTAEQAGSHARNGLTFGLQQGAS